MVLLVQAVRLVQVLQLVQVFNWFRWFKLLNGLLCSWFRWFSWSRWFIWFRRFSRDQSLGERLSDIAHALFRLHTNPDPPNPHLTLVHREQALRDESSSHSLRSTNRPSASFPNSSSSSLALFGRFPSPPCRG